MFAVVQLNSWYILWMEVALTILLDVMIVQEYGIQPMSLSLICLCQITVIIHF